MKITHHLALITLFFSLPLALIAMDTPPSAELQKLRMPIITELKNIEAELDLVLKGFHTLTQTIKPIHKQVSAQHLTQQQTLTQQLASLKARYAALQEKLEEERSLNPRIQQAQEKFEAETQYRERREEELAFSPKSWPH